MSSECACALDTVTSSYRCTIRNAIDICIIIKKVEIIIIAILLFKIIVIQRQEKQYHKIFSSVFLWVSLSLRVHAVKTLLYNHLRLGGNLKFCSGGCFMAR